MTAFLLGLTSTSAIPPLAFLLERAIANMGSTPPRCNPRRRRRIRGTQRCLRLLGPRTMFQLTLVQAHEGLFIRFHMIEQLNDSPA